MVYVGSWTVNYEEDMSIIASRFASTENLLRERQQQLGVSFTILRAGFFASNLVHLVAPTVKQHGRVELPDGFVVPAVDTRDIGSSAAAVMASFGDHSHGEKQGKEGRG